MFEAARVFLGIQSEFRHFEGVLAVCRYRTQLCKDGTSCSRHVCFFAHTMEEMRPLTVKGPVTDQKKSSIRDGQVCPLPHKSNLYIFSVERDVIRDVYRYRYLITRTQD